MKCFLTALCCFIFLGAFAHGNPAQPVITKVLPDTAGYAEYAGVYKFDENGPVKEVDVFIQNDTLAFKSPNDAGYFKRLAADSFEFTTPSYTGKVLFKRDSAGKIITMTVSVSDMEFEGTKTPADKPKNTP